MNKKWYNGIQVFAEETKTAEEILKEKEEALKQALALQDESIKSTGQKVNEMEGLLSKISKKLFGGTEEKVAVETKKEEAVKEEKSVEMHPAVDNAEIESLKKQIEALTEMVTTSNKTKLEESKAPLKNLGLDDEELSYINNANLVQIVKKVEKTVEDKYKEQKYEVTEKDVLMFLQKNPHLINTSTLNEKIKESTTGKKTLSAKEILNKI